MSEVGWVKFKQFDKSTWPDCDRAIAIHYGYTETFSDFYTIGEFHHDSHNDDYYFMKLCGCEFEKKHADRCHSIDAESVIRWRYL